MNDVSMEAKGGKSTGVTLEKNMKFNKAKRPTNKRDRKEEGQERS